MTSPVRTVRRRLSRRIDALLLDDEGYAKVPDWIVGAYVWLSRATSYGVWHAWFWRRRNVQLPPAGDVKWCSASVVRRGVPFRCSLSEHPGHMHMAAVGPFPHHIEWCS